MLLLLPRSSECVEIGMPQIISAKISPCPRPIMTLQGKIIPKPERAGNPPMERMGTSPVCAPASGSCGDEQDADRTIADRHVVGPAQYIHRLDAGV
jgi:hypothetical protein